MKKSISLKKLFHSKKFPALENDEQAEKELQLLQRKFLRIQQGIWHQKKRVILAFEGFDAAGKGGAIRRLVESVDPRGFLVHPIGPPTEMEKNKHYLYRFWKKLPEPGTMAIFDRTWYGRVLVERVEKLIPKERWKEAYAEILSFEKTLANDGIHIVKIFLAIDKKEQLKRFEDRLKDPYKQWKLTLADVEARKKWDDYVEAYDDAFENTDKDFSPWYIVPANDKPYARNQVLKIIVNELSSYGKWMENAVLKEKTHDLKVALEKLGLKEGKI